MKPSQKIIIVFILFLIGVLVTELTSAQVPTKEMPQKDKMSPPKQRKLEGGRERNPFLLPSGVYLLSKGGPTSVHKEGSAKPDAKSPEIDPQKVKAILVSDHIRLATIGRYIVTVGDTIDDEKILEIKTDRVILGKGTKKRTLLLYQSPIKLSIEEQ